MVVVMHNAHWGIFRWFIKGFTPFSDGKEAEKYLIMKVGSTL